MDLAGLGPKLVGMKSAISPKASPVVPPSVAADGAQGAKPEDQGLIERRKFIRPLPAPQAVESTGDTDWATFQALIADKP